MIWQLVNSMKRQILVDVDTQKDFFVTEGNACIRNHRRVLKNIRRLMAWARANNIEVISTCQIHTNGTLFEGKTFCRDGTTGVEKIRYTLLANRRDFAADGSSDLPGDVLRNYRQIILDKRCDDPFEEPRIERLFTEVNACEFIVIGATAEGSVERTVLGLLHRGKKVTVVTDAIGGHDSDKGKVSLRKMNAKGARLVDTKKIAGSSNLRYIGACSCKSCAS